MGISSFSFPAPIKVDVAITGTLRSHAVKDSGMARLVEIYTVETKVKRVFTAQIFLWCSSI